MDVKWHINANRPDIVIQDYKPIKALFTDMIFSSHSHISFKEYNNISKYKDCKIENGWNVKITIKFIIILIMRDQKEH